MRHYRLLVAAIIVLGALRIAATWPVFSETVDEPIHIGAGLQWLTSDRYPELEHPPLPRVLFALAPWLADRHERGDDALYEGRVWLMHDAHYVRNLALSRAPNLLFFVLGALVVAMWTRRLFGDVVALVAVAFFTALPPVLAHAGLATTDMAATATTAFALWAPPALAGVGIGLGLLSKFSFVAFFPLGLLALRRLPRVRDVAIGLLLVWAGYKFAFGTLMQTGAFIEPLSDEGVAMSYASAPGYDWVRPDIIKRYHDYANAVHSTSIDFVDWAKSAGYPSPLAGRHGDTMRGLPPVGRKPLLEPFRAAAHYARHHVRVPAPLFVSGVLFVRSHSAYGHPAYLLGQHSDRGWRGYFPLIVFFKTPLAFLILAIAGMVLLRFHPVVLIPIGILLVAMTSSLNIGVRHVLPVYPFLAICAAYAAVKLRPWSYLLVAWFVVATTLAHPDYLAYFNEAAGRHPERIALDSNLDWGQDLLRLRDAVREQHIDHLYLSYFGSADWQTLLPQAEALPPHPVRGWVAVSEMQLAFEPSVAWLKNVKPVREVGKSIRLYRLP